MNNQSKALLAFFAVVIIVGVVFLILWLEKVGPFKKNNDTTPTPTPTPTSQTTSTTTTNQTTTNQTIAGTNSTITCTGGTETSSVRTTDLGTLSRPATSPSQLYEEGVRANGYYYMDIGDGRGVTQYYVNFTLKGGPYVLIAQNTFYQTGNDALFGIQNKNSPSRQLSSSDGKNFPLDPVSYAFNTNILSMPVKRYMVMLANSNNPANLSYSYVYFVFDESNRTKWYDLLKNVNSKTYGNAANDKTSLPSIFLGKTSGEIYHGLSNPNLATELPIYRSWSNGDTVAAQHYAGWNSANWINYIIEVGANSRGHGWGGGPHLLGFSDSGTRILVQNQIDVDPMPYPPMPMTWNNVWLNSPNQYAIGNYVVSSSSGTDPFVLFDQDKAITWKSGVKYNGDYTGSEVTNYVGSSTGYRGEWIQMQMPVWIRARILRLTSSNITERRPPKDFAIFGSKDGGATWVMLGMWTNQTFVDAGQEREFYFMNNNDNYNLFRFVVNKATKVSDSDTAGYFDLSEIKLFSKNQPNTIDGSNDWHFVHF